MRRTRRLFLLVILVILGAVASVYMRQKAQEVKSRPTPPPPLKNDVSATSKDGDAYEIARRYKVGDFVDLIFSNLDQSVQHGIIYNLQKKTGKALHSFGVGARIPEDFEFASKERVLDLLFKLTKLTKLRR